MTRWLVTGATGLLGSNAIVRLSGQHEVVGAARSRPSRYRGDFIEADIEYEASRNGLIERASPNVVLHAAAMATIEACEDDPQRARAINVTAAADLAKQAETAGASFIYISTDAVFDGSKGSYRESDEPSPISEYGRTKLAGERAVLEASTNALVARVNFYGWSPTGSRSLAEYFYNRLSRGEEAPGFEDTVVSTLYVDYLIDYLVDLVELRSRGLFHVASGEPISKYEFGRLIASSFGFDPSKVIRAQSSSVLAVRRGSQMGLDVSKLESILGDRAAGQQLGIERLKEGRDERTEALSEFAKQKGK